MYKLNEIFKQTSPPHFCLKVVCKKGGGGGPISGAYGNFTQSRIYDECD